jgi:hypothetical protein
VFRVRSRLWTSTVAKLAHHEYEISSRWDFLLVVWFEVFQKTMLCIIIFVHILSWRKISPNIMAKIFTKLQHWPQHSTVCSTCFPFQGWPDWAIFHLHIACFGLFLEF